jgi:hypothetical protein
MTHATEIADFGDTTSTESAFFSQVDYFRIACNPTRLCGEGKLRTPKCENQKSCFFLCLEFRFSEQNDEIQPEKVTRKIV